MGRHRGSSGEFTESVSDEDILHFFESGQRDFYGASEVGEELGLDRSQAHRRLTQLHEAGELERVKVGRRNVVWWRPRDVVALIEEETGYSVIDPETGVASQGETRPEALRMLAEAIEAQEDTESEVAPEEVYAELGIDPMNIDADATPPWIDN